METDNTVNYVNRMAFVNAMDKSSIKLSIAYRSAKPEFTLGSFEFLQEE
jgi:hypothetical protein